MLWGRDGGRKCYVEAGGVLINKKEREREKRNVTREIQERIDIINQIEYR